MAHHLCDARVAAAADGDESARPRRQGGEQQRLRMAKLERSIITDKYADLHDGFGRDSGTKRTASEYQRAYERHRKTAATATANGVAVNDTLQRQLEYVRRMAETTREIELCEAILANTATGGGASRAMDDDGGEDDGRHDRRHPSQVVRLEVERYRYDGGGETRARRGGVADSNAPKALPTVDVALAELAQENDRAEREHTRRNGLSMSPDQFYGRGSTPSAAAGWRQAGRPATLGSRQVEAALGITPSSVPTSTTRVYTRAAIPARREEILPSSRPGTSPRNENENEVQLPGVPAVPASDERAAKRRATSSRGKKAEPMVVDLLEDSDEDNDSKPGAGTTAATAASPFELPVDLIGEEQPRRSTRASRYRSLTQLIGNLDAMYPDTAKGAVRVALADLECLKDGEMLNDQCVDFYLKYLQHETLAQLLPKVLERVHIFNSFFYQKLAQRHDNESMMDPASAAHARVKTWTKNVDIFSKDFLLIPIHRDLHWSLIVVCNPSGKPGDEREPFLLHLDSMVGGHNSSSVSTTIKNYLDKEWIAQKGKDAEPPKFTSARFMQTFRPHVPRQQNGCDCGVFILAFVEKFVTEENLDVLLTKTYAKESTEKYPNDDNQFLRRHWFPPNELADEMRTKVSMLIIQVITDNCAEDDASRAPLNEAYQIHARELDARQSITRKAEARALRAREKSEADRRTKLESLQDRKENIDDDDDDDLEVGLEVMQEKTQENTSWKKKTKPIIGVENASTRRGGTVDFLEKPWNNKPKPTTTPPTTSRYFSGTGKRVGGDTLGGSLAGKPATRGTQLMGSKSLMERFERSRGKALLSNAVGGEEEAAQAPTPPKPLANDNRSTLQAFIATKRAETRRRAAETSIDKYFTKSKAPVETVAMDADESSEDGIALPKNTDDNNDA